MGKTGLRFGCALLGLTLLQTNFNPWPQSNAFLDREYLLCAPGNTAVGECHVFTSLGSAFVEISNSASRDHLDLAVLRDFRIIANTSVAAVTGDLLIQCDADAAFGSPNTLGQLDNPSGGLTGMANGNTVESPIVRQVRLQLK